MKKFITAAVIASLIATPALANHRYRGYNQHRHNSGVSTGEAVAIGLGALLLGSALASRNNQPAYPVVVAPQPVPVVPMNAPRVTCQWVYMVDLNGNYLVDRSGRIAPPQQQCFQY